MLRLTNAQSSDMTNYIDDVVVDSKNTDAATGEKETTYVNTNWAQQWGYFNSIADLKSALIMKSIWNVGKGYTCDDYTSVILGHISGWGKDTFTDILFNLDITKRIGGDAFAEIIRDKESGTLINLKPLDPGNIRIVVDEQGIIKRYEQISKLYGKVKKTFEPEEILHLSNNRLADQIHGISDIDALTDVILAENENFKDIKKLMHHQVKPFILWKLKTDDSAKIADIVRKIDSARNLGEDMFIPDDEDAVSYEIVQVNISQAIFEWRNDIRNKFYRTIGLPQVVPGAGGQSTESESKVIYLAFEQIVEKEQKSIEDQIWNQLQLRINLNPPQSISPDLQTDAGKDGAMQQMDFQQSDVQAGVGK